MPYLSPWRAAIIRKSVGRRQIRDSRDWKDMSGHPSVSQAHSGLYFQTVNKTVMNELCPPTAGLLPFSILYSPPHSPDANSTDSLQPRCDLPPHHLHKTHSISPCRTNSPVTSNLMNSPIRTERNTYSQQDSVLEKEKLSEPQNEVTLNEVGEQYTAVAKQTTVVTWAQQPDGFVGIMAQPIKSLNP